MNSDNTQKRILFSGSGFGRLRVRHWDLQLDGVWDLFVDDVRIGLGQGDTGIGIRLFEYPVMELVPADHKRQALGVEYGTIKPGENYSVLNMDFIVSY